MIDRRQVVARHVVRLTKVDPFNPLTVGNGEFAFSADVTGLQTFPDAYAEAVPLCTMSQWGWHSTPPGPDVKPDEIRYTDFDTYGRPVPYLTSPKGQEATFTWLRENPHRLHLSRIGLRLRTAGGADATPKDLTDIEQTLDPWTGRIVSRFRFDGETVAVETTSVGETDGIAVRVSSPLLADGRLAIDFAFPYGEPQPVAADWDSPGKHRTSVRNVGPDHVELLRELDDTTYHVAVRWHGAAQFAEIGPHHFRLAAAMERGEIAFVCTFSSGVSARSAEADIASQSPTTPRRGDFSRHDTRENNPSHSSQNPQGQVPPTFTEAATAGDAMWAAYWNSGAAIDLAGSADPRAHELERRIVLSQYLMKANCAGSLPPAETGLTCNSWFGKFHLEMHWWHGVHFALWGRLPLLKKSLGYYKNILPEGRKIAERQGYAGVRWPKMVDGRGVDSPSPVGPLLLWQQPHPIYYAELCYRQSPTPDVLREWQEIVDVTADFMASYVVRDDATGHYVLGPPIKSVQENNDTKGTRNPTYELTYWRFGLKTAQAWRERLGLPRKQAWDDVLHHLAPAPHADGKYLYHDGLTNTYTEWNWEHPAVVGARGMLDGDGLDSGMMKASLEQTMKDWQWDRCWGWDFPMCAMAAARNKRPDLAIDALFIQSVKNSYGPSGHVYQRPNLPLYLPANGGLLAAVAMMAGGWDGSAGHAPGFPKEGWHVKAEGFRKLP